MNRTFFGRVGSVRDLRNFATEGSGQSIPRSNREVSVADDGLSMISIDTTDAGTSLIRRRGMLGAFSGSPYWADDRLTSVAAESGMASSLEIAFRERGPDLLNDLRGPFAIALIDATSQDALLAIDRMGIEELHFQPVNGKGLSFGTSASSLLFFEESEPAVSAQSVFDYLFFHVVPAPLGVFEGHSRLLPGEYLQFSNGRLSRKKYWKPSFTGTWSSSRASAKRELHELMRQSVKRCMSDEEIGCFLSGGIDSSTIAGVVSEFRPPARTFTVGFNEPGYDESSYAQITAEHFGTRQEIFLASPQDVVASVESISSELDMPFGNSSVLPAYLCARTAREQGIDTMLAGDGGDEVFAGNTRYVTQQLFSVYSRIPNFLRDGMIEPLAFSTPGASRFPPTRKLQSYIRQAKIPMPDRLETYNYLLRDPMHDILDRDFLESVDSNHALRLLRETYNETSDAGLLDRMLALDWKFTLADNDLRKVNWACELAGVAVRYPFLDDDLVDFSCQLSPDWKIQRWKLRAFFKYAMRDFLPTAVLKKSKQGFGLPFGVWMKSYGPLRELAYDSISSFRSRRIVAGSYLDRLLDQHRSDHAHYYGEFIWVLMMLELWFQNVARRSSGN